MNLTLYYLQHQLIRLYRPKISLNHISFPSSAQTHFLFPLSLVSHSFAHSSSSHFPFLPSLYFSNSKRTNPCVCLSLFPSSLSVSEHKQIDFVSLILAFKPLKGNKVISPIHFGEVCYVLSPLWFPHPAPIFSLILSPSSIHIFFYSFRNENSC